MNENQSLFLVIVILYLSHCFFWIDQSTLLFTGLKNKWRFVTANHSFSNSTGGLINVNPFLPSGNSFKSAFLPLAFSPEGVCVYYPDLLTGFESDKKNVDFFRYETINKVHTDGRKIVINDIVLAKCSSPEIASRLVSLIQLLIQAEPESREQIIKEFIEPLFDLKSAKKRLKSVMVAALYLRSIEYPFFIFFFFIMPVTVTLFGLLRSLLSILLMIIIFTIWNSIGFCKSHKRLYPNSGTERITQLLTMILCFPSAFRGADPLTFEALIEYHPILVASLLPSVHSKQFIESYVRELIYPVKTGPAPAEAELIIRWYTQFQLQCCQKFLKQHNPQFLSEITNPPQPESSCLCFCPRCQAQFHRVLPECPDCFGIKCIEFHTK